MRYIENSNKAIKMEDLTPLYDSIKHHEGFRAQPYPDPIHGWEVPTVGFGSTRIDITVAEKQMMLDVARIIQELSKRVAYFSILPLEVRFILVEIAYQMGVPGVMRFKRMWDALKDRDYILASQEMLDSKWAIQTPKRANSLAKRMSEVDDE